MTNKLTDDLTAEMQNTCTEIRLLLEAFQVLTSLSVTEIGLRTHKALGGASQIAFIELTVEDWGHSLTVSKHF